MLGHHSCLPEPSLEMPPGLSTNLPKRAPRAWSPPPPPTKPKSSPSNQGARGHPPAEPKALDPAPAQPPSGESEPSQRTTPLKSLRPLGKDVVLVTARPPVMVGVLPVVDKARGHRLDERLCSCTNPSKGQAQLFLLQVDEDPFQVTVKVSATAHSGLVRLRPEQEALRASWNARPAFLRPSQPPTPPKQSIMKPQPPTSLPACHLGLPVHIITPRYLPP